MYREICSADENVSKICRCEETLRNGIYLNLINGIRLKQHDALSGK